MSQKRSEDKLQEDERIERTFSVNDQWYFELRGGGQQGPFDSEEDMKNALNEFIELQKEMKS